MRTLVYICWVNEWRSEWINRKQDITEDQSHRQCNSFTWRLMCDSRNSINSYQICPVRWVLTPHPQTRRQCQECQRFKGYYQSGEVTSAIALSQASCGVGGSRLYGNNKKRNMCSARRNIYHGLWCHPPHATLVVSSSFCSFPLWKEARWLLCERNLPFLNAMWRWSSVCVQPGPSLWALEETLSPAPTIQQSSTWLNALGGLGDLSQWRIWQSKNTFINQSPDLKISHYESCIWQTRFYKTLN